MTKEQILVNITPDLNSFALFTKSKTLEAMEEYANQQVAAEREKAKKLVEALEGCISVIRELDGTSYVAYTGAKVVINDYKQSLTEYKKTISYDTNIK